jgi:predicted transcriptional regulator
MQMCIHSEVRFKTILENESLKKDMTHIGKGRRTLQILKAVAENPSNIYDYLERIGLDRKFTWQYIPVLKRWGYVEKIGRSRFKLTPKGQSVLRRLTMGQVACPLCGGLARRNGKRNGRQRWRCPRCRFYFTEGCEETIVKSLKKRKKAVFLLYCPESLALRLRNEIRFWLEDQDLKRFVGLVTF